MESLDHYLDALENEIKEAKPVRFQTQKVAVDSEEVYYIIDQIRQNFPKEIVNAKRIIDDHDTIINDAKKKADEILHDAKEQAMILVSNEKVYIDAMEEAKEIIKATKEKASSEVFEAVKKIDKMLDEANLMVAKTFEVVDSQSQVAKENLSKMSNEIYEARKSLRQTD